MSGERFDRSFWRKQVGRRDVLRGTGVVIGGAMVGLGLAGCGGSTTKQATAGPTQGVVGFIDPKSQTPVAAPTVAKKRGGSAVEVLSNTMADVFPMAGEPGCTRNSCYDHLITSNYVTGKTVLSLAASVENPDPTTYIFKIKPNAKHHNLPPVNGRNVTSEDVNASWQYYQNHPRTPNKGAYANSVDRVQTPDAATVNVKMKKANTWVLGPHGPFAAPFPGVIGPKELFDGDKIMTTCVGPGGFVLDKFDANSGISFKRRPDPWHNEGPYLDSFSQIVITDAAVRAAALKSKQIDRLDARDRLEAEEFKTFGADLAIKKQANGNTPMVLLLRADKPDGLFNDVRVREAVYAVLDIQELIDKVDIGDGEFSGPVPPFLMGYTLPVDEIKKQYPKDLNKAKQLLAAAGWDTTKEVELKYPTTPANVGLVAERLQLQLAAGGIKTKLVPQDLLNVFTNVTINQREFQMAVNQSGYIVDPDYRLRVHTTQGSTGVNTCSWSDPEVDAIVASNQVEFDEDKQKRIILDAQRLLYKKFTPLVPLEMNYLYTGYWKYYHPAWNMEVGFTDLLMCGQWTETDHPAYPKDRK